LTDRHIADFKTALVSEGLAAATVGKVLGLVKQSLQAAVEAREIPRNPASSVKRPSVTADAVERRALDEQEVGLLVEAAIGTPFDVPIRFALATGCRQSEMLGARWTDVELDRGTFTITQTIQHVRGEGFKTLRPKTANSRRAIELSPATVKMLKAHRIRQAEQRLRLGSIWQDEDLVFPDATGGPQHRRTFLAGYREIVQDSGITNAENVNWHCLRHTAASLWLKRGIDVFVVSRRLGHSNAGFTMRVYSHLLPGQQAPAAAALDDLLASG
ncbi:MAG: site-specific integrase, partial [Chloroflexi bacterium]|nr:site-specific integrase [Chloroflexota bacterium]